MKKFKFQTTLAIIAICLLAVVFNYKAQNITFDSNNELINWIKSITPLHKGIFCLIIGWFFGCVGTFLLFLISYLRYIGAGLKKKFIFLVMGIIYIVVAYHIFKYGLLFM